MQWAHRPPFGLVQCVLFESDKGSLWCEFCCGVGAHEHCCCLLLQSPLGKYLSEEGWPGAAVQSKDELEKYVRTSACSGNALTGEHHATGGLFRVQGSQIDTTACSGNALTGGHGWWRGSGSDVVSDAAV